MLFGDLDRAQVTCSRAGTNQKPAREKGRVREGNRETGRERRRRSQERERGRERHEQTSKEAKHAVPCELALENRNVGSTVTRIIIFIIIITFITAAAIIIIIITTTTSNIITADRPVLRRKRVFFSSEELRRNTEGPRAGKHGRRFLSFFSFLLNISKK